MSLEVALLEWSQEGRVRMLGRSGDPQLISLVRECLVEQITGYEGHQPLTLVRGGEQVPDEATQQDEEAPS